MSPNSSLGRLLFCKSVLSRVIPRSNCLVVDDDTRLRCGVCEHYVFGVDVEDDCPYTTEQSVLLGSDSPEQNWCLKGVLE